MEIKNYRKFPKHWDNSLYSNLKVKDQIGDFCHLCKEIYLNLTLIKMYDKEKFNKLSPHIIDTYIELFDNLYREFFNEVFLIDYNQMYNNLYANTQYCGNDMGIWKTSHRFDMEINQLNEQKFHTVDINLNYPTSDKSLSAQSQDNNLKLHFIVGIKDEYYDAIKSKVNSIILFEQELKSITMKPEFWKGIAQTKNDIYLDEKFTICGKIIYENGWRLFSNKSLVKSFGKKKIYQSASIINENQPNKLFTPVTSNPIKAFLIYEFDLNKVCCISTTDAYSDEFIDGKTNFKELSLHTDIQKITEDNVNGFKHELFAYSPVFSTLQCMLRSLSFYNEVVLKQPKPIAVVALNSKSIDFAKQVAKENNVDYLGVMNNKITISNLFNEDSF